jgi:hypothetical protein
MSFPFMLAGDHVTISAAGSSQSDAAIAGSAIVSVNAVATGEGVVLMAKGPRVISMVSNEDATESLYVYPWVGASINGNAANAPVDLPAGHAAMFVEIDNTHIIGMF